MVNFPPVDLDCSDSVAQASLSLALSPRRREKRTHGSHARVTHVTHYPLDSFGLIWTHGPMEPYGPMDAFGLFAKFALMYLPSFASNKLAGTVVCCWWPWGAFTSTSTSRNGIASGLTVRTAEWLWDWSVSNEWTHQMRLLFIDIIGNVRIQSRLCHDYVISVYKAVAPI